MPRFLLEKDNQVQVLLCAFFILLVLIPGTVYFNYADSTHKDELGVLLDNKRWYGAELNENYLFKNVPLSLYRCIEFQSQIKTRSKEDLDLQRRLKDVEKIQEHLPRTVSKKTVGLNLKPLLLILGHMMREDAVEN